MDATLIFAIAACLMSAGVVYVVLNVRQYGENQAAAERLLKAQTEISLVKTKLAAYTAYTKQLEPALRALADQMRAPQARFWRDYVYAEALPIDLYKLKSKATVVNKYAVEFCFGVDVSSLELTAVAGGVSLRMTRPYLVGEPIVNTQSQQIFSISAIPDEKAVMADLDAKFVEQAKAYGTAVSTEDAVRAQCKLKALEFLRTILSQQPGVEHVPAIFVEFK